MPPTQETIPCPQCGQPVDVDIWQVLDLAREPELRRRFLQGEINALRCDSCGAAGMLGEPLAVHDPAGEQVIFFIPGDPQITPEMLADIQRDLGNALMRDWAGNYSDYLFRPTLARNPMELVQMLAAVEMTGSEENNAERAIQQLYETIWAFIQAETWNDTQHIVENHPELLSDAADLMLIQMIEAARQEGDEDIKALFVDHLALLRHCREIGIEAAFAEKFGSSSAEDENILPEIERHFEALTPEQRQTFFEMAQEFSQLHQPSDMTRRVELSHQMLQMINRTDNAQFWAALQDGLGCDFAQNLQGNRADNLEQAIYHFEQALTAINRDTMPADWAQTMMNLANAYSNRIRGDRAKNIELAIDAYQQSLEVTTRHARPVGWADTMMNLATAYRNRIRGDRAENIELAIDAYRQSLEVTTREAMPVDWAGTMNNLANAYLVRIRGDRAENIEQAIKTYQQALTVRTEATMPIEWANTINNLANAYADRIRGDRAENIEHAIEGYQQSLTVRTKEMMPVKWADSMNNLGIVYKDRIRGDRAENIEHAIEAYEQALTVFTKAEMPVDWAETMINLANAYSKRIREDRAENIEHAIEAYQQVLTIFTEFSMPVRWAETMINLANAYAQRIRGDRAENIEQAIKTHQQVLTIRTKEAMPVEWAATMGNLAVAFAERIRGDRAENIEQAIEAYQQALTVFTKATMPADWAATMMNLANAYQDRIRGDIAENIEQAIKAYQQVLTVRTKEAMPADWAATMMNLANAYRDRIRGDIAENIEQAIEASQLALKVFTKATMPADWAATMMNLANAYLERIRGGRAENIEQAIEVYQQALTVRTKEAMPVEWAATMINLANAYLERIRGDRAENIEQAIEVYQQALTVRTKEAMPVEWAETMHNLASAYAQRIRGSRAENIERSIEVYQQILTVRTKEAMPVEWAVTMSGSATAHNRRIHGRDMENIEYAIEAYQQALTVITKATMPVKWAGVMNNLGATYSNRIQGNHAENIERAIEAYQQALTVSTKEAMPVEWARTQENLANAYRDRIKGERAENLEMAIYYYSQVLDVRTRSASPIEWSQTMENLAIAYSYRIQGDRLENIERAVEACQQSLEVTTRQAMPADHLRTQRNLGNLYFGERRWSEAQVAYNAAIEAGRALLAVAVTDVGRRAEVAETAQLFARSAYCQLQQGQPLEALLTLEQGKTRLLTEALALSGVNLALLSAAEQQRYQRAVERVRSLEAKLRLPPREELTGFEKPVSSERDIIAALSQARADLNALIDTIRQEQPDFLPTGLDLEQLLSLIPPGGALVAPLITSQGSAVFVLPDGAEEQGSRGAGEYVVWLDEFTEDDLRAILIGTEESPGWLRVYLENRSNPTRWFAAIEETNDLLGEKLVAPIVEKLTILGVNPGAPLLIMPQGGLGLLPLHAASPPAPLPRAGEGSSAGDGRQVTRRTLLDDYLISYAPSGYALHAARQRLAEPNRQRQSLLSVVDPKKDITYAADVAQIFRNLKPRNDQVISLAKAEATLAAVKAAVPGQMLLDFFCHGQYGWGDPLESGLALADKTLTLKNLITDFDLSTTRLVLLWACETGITDIRQSPDEFVGLPAGFLQAGAPGVISTLWSVNQLSTLLLVEKFYQFYLQDDLVIPEALHQAQLWLRTLTAGKLAKRFSEERQALLSNTRMTKATVSEQFRRFNVMEPHERPFEHPYYWAAFTFSGA